jgi:hypothetical protein
MNEFQTVAFLLLWVVIIVEGILIFFLYRHVGLIYTGKMDGLPVGSKIPSFKAQTTEGLSLNSEDMIFSEIQ